MLELMREQIAKNRGILLAICGPCAPRCSVSSMVVVTRICSVWRRERGLCPRLVLPWLPQLRIRQPLCPLREVLWGGADEEDEDEEEADYEEEVIT